MFASIHSKIVAGLSMIALLAAGCSSNAVSPSDVASSQDGQGTSAGAQSGKALSHIKDSGTLKVGTEAQYAPYEFKDKEANFAGADIVLAQKIADKLGVKLQVVDMSFDGIIPAVQSGQVDLGIAAFSTTPDRAKVIDFSDPYEKSAQVLIVAAQKKDTYTTAASLKGQKVGAQKGSIQSQLVTQGLPDSTLFEAEKYPNLALETQNGNIAGFVVDQAVGNQLVDTSNGALAASSFKFDDSVAQVGKAVVMAKGNDDLKSAVDDVIKQMTADGSYKKAYDDAVKLAASLGLNSDN
ncbi:MAG: ABC transporter substrate-binding protein [Actinomycetaceae bacterium]|nr:ABC transporter substrate-binding protein [Actinomycetaceae bacterium]MDY6083597.1 ABC transporter substrate-binding protein [Actinomycetaceae bacterium]